MSATVTNGGIPPLTAEALFRSTWPRHTTKRVAAASRGSLSTAKHWVLGAMSPSANTLLRMAQENQELREAMIRALAGERYAEIVAELGGTQGEALRAEVARRRGVAGGAEGGR